MPIGPCQEVSETRSRQVPAAQQEARVSLVGNELSVECAFGDKELVKLSRLPVVGAAAALVLPASPMALDLLREHFQGRGRSRRVCFGLPRPEAQR